MEPKTSKTELIPTLDRLEEKNPNGPGNKRPLSHALYKKNDIFLHFMAELKIFHAFNSVDKTNLSSYKSPPLSVGAAPPFLRKHTSPSDIFSFG